MDPFKDTVLVRVSIAVKTHNDRGYSYEEKYLIRWITVSRVIIMVGSTLVYKQT